MKLRGLALYGVGVHDGPIVSNIGDGLTILFGPNEAGKSTLLAGLRGLLFGRVTHLEAPITMRRGARAVGHVEDADGLVWQVERTLSGRRRHQPTLLSPDGVERKGDAAWTRQFPELAAVEELIYQSVFTFQLAELRDVRGIEGIEERVYAIGSPGGLSPFALEQRLAEEAKRLYNADARARTAQLIQCLREISEVRDELAALHDTPQAYARAVEDRQRAEAECADIEMRLATAESEWARCKKLRDVQPLYHEWRLLTERMRALETGAAGADLPEWFVLDELRAESRAAEQRLEQLREVEANIDRLTARVQSLAAGLSPAWSEAGDTTANPDGQYSSLRLYDGVLATARQHQETLQACAAHIQAAELSCVDGRRRLAESEASLQRLGWVPGRDRAALEADCLAIDDEMETLADEDDRLDDLKQRAAEWASVHQEAVAVRRGMAQQKQRSRLQAASSMRRRWMAVGVAWMGVSMVIAVVEWARHLVFAGAISAVLGIGGFILAAWTRSERAPASARGASEVDGQMFGWGSQLDDRFSLVAARLETLQAAVMEAAGRLQVVGHQVAALQESLEQAGTMIQDLDEPHTDWRVHIQSAREALRSRKRDAQMRHERAVAIQNAYASADQFRARLADDEVKLAHVRQHRAVAELEWEAFVTGLGLAGAPPTPTEFLEEAQKVLQIRSLYVEREQNQQRAAQLTQTLQAFLKRVEAMVAAQVDEGRVTADGSDALTSAFNRGQQELQCALDAARERREIGQQRDGLWLQVTTMAGGSEVITQWADELEQRDLDQLEADVERWRGEVAHWREALESARRQVWTFTAALEHWTDSRKTAELSLRLSRLEAGREALARRWAAKMVAVSLVRQARLRFEQERQPALLRVAGDVFAEMTAGKYQTLRVHADDAAGGADRAAPGMFAVTPSGEEWRVERLSRGTREQIYLAMRLAMIREYAVRNERLPLVLDDPLVNFDGPRLGAAFDVLQQEAKDGQMLYLTCHTHVVELAARAGIRVLSLTSAASHKE